MRIIAGIFKGRKILQPVDTSTRPLKDMVRESIFNILEHSRLTDNKLKNLNVLDLYSGVGSFGLECLSRGAKMVTFVEINFEALKILKENLLKLSIHKHAEIIKNRIENIKKWKKKYNIFFLDPPFKDLRFIDNLKELKNQKIYKKNHLIIIHREKNSKDDFEGILKILNEKVYGRSKITFALFK